MKILHFADAHIDIANRGRRDPETGLPLRVLDFLKSLDTIVDAAIEERVAMVIFAGDAYSGRSPTRAIQREWGRRINRLSEAKIPTLLLIGHDDISPASGRALETHEFDTLHMPYVKTLAKPELLRQKDLWDLPLQVVAIPWLSRAQLMTSVKTSAADKAERSSNSEARLIEIVEGLLGGIDPMLPTILTAHASVQGAKFGSERMLIRGADQVLPISLLRDARLDYVAMGHIHTAQDVNGGGQPPIVYPGPIEHFDFREANDDRFFVMADVTKGHTDVHWVKLEDLRRFIDRRVELQSPENVTATLIGALPSAQELDGAIIRLIVEYPLEYDTLIDDATLRKHTGKALEFQLVRRPQISVRARLPGYVNGPSPLEQKAIEMPDEKTQKKASGHPPTSAPNSEQTEASDPSEQGSDFTGAEPPEYRLEGDEAAKPIIVGNISGDEVEVNAARDYVPLEKLGLSRRDRVLNAGFAVRNAMLGPQQALQSNQQYNLLVDIGPRWPASQSIVVPSRKAVFPSRQLPSTRDGYLVRVAFVSEDFSPRLTSAEMWVPSERGQSYPVVGERRERNPGPVTLLVTTPKMRTAQMRMTAHGRLCMYYQGQLIQSASVSVNIARKGARSKQRNKIEVDYVLTRKLTDFPARLGSRRVRIQQDQDASPVSVSLTMNDDGSGRHRILATYQMASHTESTIPPAWAPYDAKSAEKVLEEFRKVIATCYKGLDQSFGKPRKQFEQDLLELAKVGDRLRTLALSDLDVSGTGRGSVALWRHELLEVMKSATVIQIARTGPANYVFPWALVYEYPMPGPEYKLCQVINQWGEGGIRTTGPALACPYSDEPWHQENIVCPYGFWGLKHIIEQPPGALHGKDGKWSLDVGEKIVVQRDVGVGVGLTFDIEQAGREAHIRRLMTGMNAHLDPLLPAHDRKTALEMLRSPAIVYFLCHGEVDQGMTPYLSIGEHVNNLDHRIYPNTLEQWSSISQGGLDLKAWQERHPLVFINGCHTAELQPGVVLNFVTAFTDLGASGVIGTEVSVLADMAMVMAEEVLCRIGDGMEIGQAIREMRWEMLNRGNLLGLAYTPYGLANLRLERAH